jgi:hypothetical protein
VVCNSNCCCCCCDSKNQRNQWCHHALVFLFDIKAFSLSRFGLGRCAPATSWQTK